MAYCGKEDCCTSTGICGSTTHGKGELSDCGYWEFPCEVCDKEEACREAEKTAAMKRILDKLRPHFSDILNETKHPKLDRGRALGALFAELFEEAYDAGKYSAGK